MPQSSTWPPLYDFESVIETAVAAELVDRGLGAPNESRGTSTLTTPRIELDCQVGPADQQNYGIRSSDSEPFLRMWRGRLVVTVITTRSVVAERAAHQTYVGTVRWALQDHEALSARMTYHALASMIESGTNRRVVSESDYDISEISFDWRIGILDGSWPSVDYPDMLTTEDPRVRITDENGDPIMIG